MFSRDRSASKPDIRIVSARPRQWAGTKLDIESITRPVKSGFLYRRYLMQWKPLWFCLHGTQLFFYNREQDADRGTTEGNLDLVGRGVSQVSCHGRSYCIEVTDTQGSKGILLSAETEKECLDWKAYLQAAATQAPTRTGILRSPSERLVDHLVIVIGDIGASPQRQGTAETLRKTEEFVLGHLFPEVNVWVEFIQVDIVGLASLDDSWQKITNVTPHHGSTKADAFRSFVRNLLEDTLYYNTPHYHHYFLKSAAAQLNTKYARFRDKYMNFSGRVSLMGHGIGSVLAWDVATASHTDSKIDFRISNLFLTGSHLGMCLSMRKAFLYQTIPEHRLPFNVFNVLHPKDPVPYFLEPLVEKPPSLPPAEFSPAIIPHWRTMGARLNNLLQSSMGFFGRKSLDAGSAEFCTLLLRVDGSRRVSDHVLQRKTGDDLKTDAESSRQAHWSYFDSHDFMLLMLSHIIDQTFGAHAHTYAPSRPFTPTIPDLGLSSQKDDTHHEGGQRDGILNAAVAKLQGAVGGAASGAGGQSRVPSAPLRSELQSKQEGNCGDPLSALGGAAAAFTQAAGAGVQRLEAEIQSLTAENKALREQLRMTTSPPAPTSDVDANQKVKKLVKEIMAESYEALCDDVDEAAAYTGVQVLDKTRKAMKTTTLQRLNKL